VLLVTAKVRHERTQSRQLRDFVYGEERLGDNTLEMTQQFSDISEIRFLFGYEATAYGAPPPLPVVRFRFE